MLLQFTRFIEQHNLCARDQHVFVAVSGGIDSMVLLHLFVEAGFKVEAVHVNFKLRGDESDRDEEFVRQHAARLGVPFQTRAVSTNNYATGEKVSIQMAARDLRRQWFFELLASKPGSVLATAHHANDLGETMVMNLIRGTGIDGLTGIPTENDGIIRPLSFATRADIEAYATEKAIVWREDASNAEDHYRRNFIRHRVLRVMKELNPSLDDTLQRNTARLGGERELLQRSTDDWKKTFVVEKGNQVMIQKAGLDGFIHQAGVLLRMIEDFGFNFAQAEGIVAAMKGQVGKIFLSPTHRLTVDREALVIERSEISDTSVLVPGFKSIAKLNEQELELHELTDVFISKDQLRPTVDADLLQFPLEWRVWRDGDWFQPLGMLGRKKISDFLTDEKVSAAAKPLATVLVSGGDVVWVCGLRLDDRFKIGPSTRRAAQLILKTK